MRTKLHALYCSMVNFIGTSVNLEDLVIEYCLCVYKMRVVFVVFRFSDDDSSALCTDAMTCV